MAFLTHHNLIFIFGVLGNIVSFCVYLAPIPTFVRICKKKTTDGFQSLPYLVALFSSMLWIYYALHKSNDYLLITINSFGCVIETIYIGIYIAYAPKQPKAFTLKLLLLLNFGGFSAIVILCHFFAKGDLQVTVLGWLCVALSIGAFAAPLSIMRLVIRTKSVEFMPFYLSLFLTLSAVMWFSYGLLLKDPYITLPNIIGLIFGAMQMILYAIYRKCNKVVVEEEKPKIPEHTINIIEITAPDSMINSNNNNNNNNSVVVSNNDDTNTKDNQDDHFQEQTRTTNVDDDERNACERATWNERCMVAPIDHVQIIPCAAA